MPTFSYTGGVQTWVVPEGVKRVLLEAYGAKGGNGLNLGGQGGNGAYAKGELDVTPGETLYIYVGGMGANGNGDTTTRAAGGYNGGGLGGDGANANESGAGGGGASDVRRNGQNLSNRVIVAGGGGGGGGGSASTGASGGAGGTTAGLAGGNSGAAGQGVGGGGGTQSAGGSVYNTARNASAGSLGQGGFGTYGVNAYGSGGGGGGYYGGGGGTSNVDHGSGYSGGGGGGSSYISGLTNNLMSSGTNSTHGSVVITTLNTLPTEPTNVYADPFEVIAGEAATIRWTHNDPDADPQVKYQLRWRKGGAATWTQGAVTTSSNPVGTIDTANFATGTTTAGGAAGLVQSRVGATTSGASCSATFAAPVAAGNQIIAIMSTNRASGTAIIPEGFTEISRESQSGGSNIVTARKTAVGGETTVTFTATQTGTRMLLTILELQYVDVAGITAAGSVGASVSALRSAAVNKEALLIAAVGLGTDTPNPAGWGGWTDGFTTISAHNSQAGSNNIGQSVASKSVVPATSTSTEQSWGVLLPASMTILAFPGTETTNVTYDLGTYETGVATSDAAGFGPYSDIAFFELVQEKPASVTAVSPGLNTAATEPIVGTGAIVYARPAIVTLAAVAPQVSIESTVYAVAAAIELFIPLADAGVKYEIQAVPPTYPIELPGGGPVTIYWNGLIATAPRLVTRAVPPTTTVYVASAPRVYTEAEYRTRFTDGFTTITRRVEILNADGETLWDDQAGNHSRLITGNVSVDYSRDERRSCDLELANFDGALVHKPGGFWYDKVMRLWRGIRFYDETGLRNYEVPVGVFMIDRVGEARFPKTVKVTARDFTKKCMLSKFTQATNFKATQSVESVIQTLAANCGVHNRVLPTTGKTLGIDRLFERGKSRWEAMKEVATAFGYELFFDAQGYLVMREFLDPTLSPVSHDFLTGPSTGNLVNWEKSANDTRIFNHISVIGAESDSAPVWADAINTNPLSPTNVDLLGDRVDTFESALVTTFAQAQELADTFLKIAALEEFEINLESIVYPWLEAGEIVRFQDPESTSNEPDRFLLTNFSIPMGLQPMSAVGRRVTIVS